MIRRLHALITPEQDTTGKVEEEWMSKMVGVSDGGEVVQVSVEAHRLAKTSP
jgi:hypothetical protein